MFKKIILAAVAFSFVGASLAPAQDYYPARKHGNHRAEPARPSYRLEPVRPAPGRDFHRNDRRAYEQRRWSKGQRYSDWRRDQEIRDYRRYGLRAPGRGQQWVRVNDQFLLITAATGLIVGILATQR